MPRTPCVRGCFPGASLVLSSARAALYAGRISTQLAEELQLLRGSEESPQTVLADGIIALLQNDRSTARDFCEAVALLPASAAVGARDWNTWHQPWCPRRDRKLALELANAIDAGAGRWWHIVERTACYMKVRLPGRYWQTEHVRSLPPASAVWRDCALRANGTPWAPSDLRRVKRQARRTSRSDAFEHLIRSACALGNRPSDRTPMWSSREPFARGFAAVYSALALLERGRRPDQIAALEHALSEWDHVVTATGGLRLDNADPALRYLSNRVVEELAEQVFTRRISLPCF